VSEVSAIIALIRSALAGYAFTPQNEAELQSQVSDVLSRVLIAGMVIEREHRAASGRYDILVSLDGLRIVLELKVKGSATEVERQTQRYALDPDVDAVVVVTTKQALAARLLEVGGRALGGKPFDVIALRGF
jgi:hypothetical protein